LTEKPKLMDPKHFQAIFQSRAMVPVKDSMVKVESNAIFVLLSFLAYVLNSVCLHVKNNKWDYFLGRRLHISPNIYLSHKFREETRERNIVFMK